MVVFDLLEGVDFEAGEAITAAEIAVVVDEGGVARGLETGGEGI